MPSTPRTHHRSNLLLALALAVATSWATRGPSPLQQPEERLIGRWTIVAQVTAPWGTPVPDLGRSRLPVLVGSPPEIMEFFTDGSMRRYANSPADANALYGGYALYDSGEFTMELRRRAEMTRTIFVTGEVRFERDFAQIRGRLTDQTTSADAHVAYLIQAVR